MLQFNTDFYPIHSLLALETLENDISPFVGSPNYVKTVTFRCKLHSKIHKRKFSLFFHSINIIIIFHVFEGRKKNKEEWEILALS